MGRINAELYIWNLRDTPTVRAVVDYNIYYATGPVTAFPATATNASVVDYSFTAGNGWTLFNLSTLTLAAPSGQDAEAVISLGGISAQYIAIEILSAAGGTTTDRLGLNEMTVTAVPEPSTLALIGLAGLALFIRRRR